MSTLLKKNPMLIIVQVWWWSFISHLIHNM